MKRGLIMVFLGFVMSVSVALAGGPKMESSVSDAMAKAKAEGKPAILIFSASWCPPCQQMKKKVYPDAKVKPYHEQLVWAYIDTDKKSNQADAKKYGVSGIPHYAIVDGNGKVLSTFTGGRAPGDFTKLLDAALKKADKSSASSKPAVTTDSKRL